MIMHDMKSLSRPEYKTDNIVPCSKERRYDAILWDKWNLDAYPLAVFYIVVPEKFDEGSFFR